MADYLFIDMHMHTSFSNEDLCTETPRHILGKVQGYVDKYNQENGTNENCCISFADHNSILASVEARRLLASGLYPNVKYINGCEFTTDMCEVNNAIGLANCFTRSHVLAYGFDENNAELQAYSRITHKRFSNEDNVGLQILAARRAVCEMYNIYIPFSEFLPLLPLLHYADHYSPFIKIITNYLEKNEIKYDLYQICNECSHYLIGARNYVEDATSFGRLKLSEVCKLIKDAGGKMVLAHPSIVKISAEKAKEILKQENVEISESLEKKLSGAKSRLEIMQLEEDGFRVVLNKILKATPLVCGGANFDGMESMIGINFVKRTDKVIKNICKEQNMFQTAGSDYHGENFACHKTIGNCFEQEMQREFGISNSRLQDRNLFVRISNLPIVDYFVEGKPIESFYASYIDENFKPLLWEEIDDCIDNALNKRKQRREKNKKDKKIEEFSGTEEIKQNIKNLAFIAAKYNKILKKSQEYRNRRRLVLKLEKFCFGIFEGLKKFQKNFREHSENYDNEDVKQITKLLKEIHRKYYEMQRLDNGLVHYVKNELRAKGRKSMLDKIANITIDKSK